MPETDPPEAHGIRSLFRRSWAGATVLLGAGVSLEALEFYVTASLMPSMVRDIGGLEFMAWTTSLFVAALVLGSIAIIIRPAGMTLRQVYVIGAVIFAAGCLIVGFSPSMPVVLFGRFVQGFGAGLLVTLAYSFIRHVYPPGMQNAASAFYSALWGVATLLGPGMGGYFAHDSAWRWAFFILIPIALLMALVAPKLLPEGEDEREKEGVPALQIGIIVAGILAVSYAGNVETTGARTLLLTAGVASLLAFVFAERRLRPRLMPEAATLFGHPLARTLSVMFLLITVLNADIFVPYFLQVLHALTPLMAGYIVALVATGWALAGMATASWSGRRAQGAIIAGPVLLSLAVLSLALLISQRNLEGDLVTVALVASSLLAMGLGIGTGWAHLVSLVITLGDGPEADKASAAINLVPSIAAAFGAALAGVIVNTAGLVEPGGVEGASAAAFWLYALMALPAAAAFLVAIVIVRRQRVDTA